MKHTIKTILAALALFAFAATGAEAAFSNSLLVRASVSQDSTSPRIWIYESTGETIATITAANYFAADPQRLSAGDLVYVKGSDGVRLVTVTSASTSASVVGRFSGSNCFNATTTYDPGNLVDTAGETSSGITVTGAALGDFCQVAAPYDMQDILATCYVQATDTVEIRLQNESGNTVNLASGSWKVEVCK